MNHLFYTKCAIHRAKHRKKCLECERFLRERIILEEHVRILRNKELLDEFLMRIHYRDGAEVHSQEVLRRMSRP